MKNQLLFIIVITFIFIAGCTRISDVSTVSFNLPSPKNLHPYAERLQKAGLDSALSGDEGDSYHIAINVSGDGVQIFCSFDSKAAVSAGPCEFSGSNVTMEVPSGSDRLFQVFYAIDSETGMNMRYGEITQTVSGSATSVEIGTSQIGASSTVMGMISGRYIDGTSGTPIYDSGLLQVKYNPSTGKPAMTIMQTEMYKGWFDHIITLDAGVKLSYVVNGKKLFTDLLSSGQLEYSDFSTFAMGAGASQVKIQSGGGESKIVGWFGPGRLTQTTEVSQPSCNSVNEFNSCLVNASLGIYSAILSPFIGDQTGRYATDDGSNLYVKMAPGLTVGTSATDDFSNVKIFRFTQVSDPSLLKPYFLNEGNWNCQAIKNNTSTANTFNASYLGSSKYGIQKSAIVSPGLHQDDIFVFCPEVNGQLRTAAVLFPDRFQDFGYGGYQGPYLHLNFSGGPVHQSAQDTYGLTKSECYQIDLGSYEGHGSQFQTTSSVTATLTTSASGSFYSDSGCTAGANTTSTLTINSASYSSATPIYFKPLAVGSSSITMVASDSAYSASAQQIDVGLPTLRIIGSSKLNQSECAFYQVQKLDPYGNPIIVGSPLAINFNLPAGLNLFSDAGCSSSLVSPNIAVSYSSLGFYVKRTSASGSEVFGFQSLAPHLSSDYNLQGVTISPRTSSSPALSVKFTILDSALIPGKCLNAKFTLNNAAAEEVITPSTFRFSAASRGMRIFNSSGGCWGDDIVDFEIPAGGSELYVKVMPIAVGQIALDTRDTSEGLVLSSVYNVGFSATSPTSFGFASTTIPDWRNRVVGSHEFVTPTRTYREMTLALNVTTEIQCQISPPGAPVWSNCPGGMIDQATGVFKWELSDALQKKQFKFSVSGSGYSELNFDPNAYFGSNFQVRECDFIYFGVSVSRTQITAGFTPGTNATGANSGTNHGVICFGQGAQTLVMNDSNINPNSIIPGGAPALIGWIGNNLTDRGSLSFGSGYLIRPVRGGATALNFLIANLNVFTVGSPSAFYVDEGAETASGQVLLSNMYFKAMSSGTSGSLIKIANIEMTHIALSDVVIDTNHANSGFTTVGLSLDDIKSNSNSGFSARGLNFQNTALPISQNEVPTYISISRTDLNGNTNYSFDRVKTSGRAQIFKAVSGLSFYNEVIARRFKIEDVAVSSSSGLFSLEGLTVLRIENSSIISSALNSPIFHHEATNATPQQELRLYNNRIEVKRDVSLISGGLAPSTSPELKIFGNHFLRTGNGLSTAPMIDFSSLSGGGVSLKGEFVSLMGGSFVGTSTGQNRTCGDLIGRGWSETFTLGSASIGTATQLSGAAYISQSPTHSTQVSGYNYCLAP